MAKKEVSTTQFYKSFSVYLSSMQRMTIPIRYKRKDRQVGLGIKVHKVICQRPLSGLSMPVK